MGQTNFFKIFSIVAFIAFASVSCWATAESLHLLLSSWPLVLCWVVTIGFFAIASFGTLMIVNSFNQNIYMEKRGLHLLGGILIILSFWLVCIMPTNTHTFFFRNVINDKVTSDIVTTQNYLNQIMTNELTKNKINDKSSELRNKVMIKEGELIAEIKNEANPSLGAKARAILQDLSVLLGVEKIEVLSTNGGNSKQELEKICNAYITKINLLLENRLSVLEKEMTPTNSNYMKQAAENWGQLERVKEDVNNKKLNLNNADNIKLICDKLNAGYATINAYPQFVDFKNNKSDEASYSATNPVTKVKRLTSVFDVWADFLKGNYAGHGFFFWVLISILVDVAAFIFFDISFKRQN